MEHFDEELLNVIDIFNKANKKKQEDERLDEIIIQINNNLITENELDLEMEQKTLFNRLVIYLPNDFEKMSAENMKVKYPSETRPKIIFTSDDESVNIGFNILNQDEDVADEDISEYRDLMIYFYVQINPNVKMLDSGDFKIADNTTVAYYTFPNFAIGGQIYNVVSVLQIDKKVVVINMNCLKKDMDKYELMFQGILKTILIKDEE